LTTPILIGVPQGTPETANPTLLIDFGPVPAHVSARRAVEAVGAPFQTGFSAQNLFSLTRRGVETVDLLDDFSSTLPINSPAVNKTCVELIDLHAEADEVPYITSEYTSNRATELEDPAPGSIPSSPVSVASPPEISSDCEGNTVPEVSVGGVYS